MLKVLGKIILSIALLCFYLFCLVATSVWTMNPKEITILCIIEFLGLWDIDSNELYIKGRR